MKLPTASKLGLASKCAGSHVLDWHDKPGPAAKVGKRIHKYLELAMEDKTVDFIDLKIPPYLRKVCAKIDVRALQASLIDITTEVSYAWHYERMQSTILGAKLDRDYKLGAYDIAGTADVVASNGRYPVVIDFKTGRSIGPVKDAWQMRLLAMQVGVYLGAERVEARAVYIDPRYGEIREQQSHDVHTFDAIDFGVDGLEVKEIVSNIDTASKTLLPMLRPGTHCDTMWCPARKVCPRYEGVNK